MNAQVENGQEAQAKPAKPKTEVEKVSMLDGRTVEFAGKKKLLKDYALDEAGNLAYIQLDFRNGDSRKITIPSALLGQFAGHGAIQKYGDALAGLKGVDGGEPDIEDMVLEIDDLDSRIQKGEWSAAREASGMGGTSILIKALMEYGGQTLENVKQFLGDKDQKFKIALRNNDKRPNKSGVTLKAIVQRLESEKAAKASKVDTDTALAGLDAMEAAG